MRPSRAIICLLVYLSASASSEQLPSPVTTEVQRTQHFEKFVLTNKSSIPVTVRLSLSGGANVRLTKEMPLLLVVPQRSTREAFAASHKDPRKRYKRPRLKEEFILGDFRLPSSNLPTVLPWKPGQKATVSQSSSRGALTFRMDEGSEVTCARSGLVVSIEEDTVVIAHDDGSVSQYSKLRAVRATLGQDIAADDAVGITGAEGLRFELAVPTRSLEYQPIPCTFTLEDGKEELSVGREYKR